MAMQRELAVNFWEEVIQVLQHLANIQFLLLAFNFRFDYYQRRRHWRTTPILDETQTRFLILNNAYFSPKKLIVFE